jgi:hypothetical protein
MNVMIYAIGLEFLTYRWAQLRSKSYGTSLTQPFLGSFTILGI